MTVCRWLLGIALVLVALALPLPGAGGGAIAAEPAGRFVVFSDIHFNPFDPPELAADLAAASPEGWPALFEGIGTQTASQYGADTNYALLKSALGAVSPVAVDADFLVVPGDFLVHRFHEKAAAALGRDESSEVIDDLKAKTTLFVAQQLRAAAPGKPLIVALGNNDSDCGDYRLQPAGPYLAATADIVRELAGEAALDADFDETYRLGGYYAMRHPTLADTVILVLSDTLWSAKYEDSCGMQGGVDGAQAMLTWLEDRLARAHEEGDRVWLVRHIPAGIDAYSTAESEAATCAGRVVPFLREPYATRLPDLLRSYAAPVLVSLTGHVHHDSYRLLTDEAGVAIDVNKIVPAISPVFRQNPGFQSFDYDIATGQVTDFETWYLTDLDATTLKSPGTWRKEYRFTEAYDLPEFSAASVERLWRSIGEPGPARNTFARLYQVSYRSLTDAELPAYVCAIRYHDVDRYAACYCGG